MIATALQWLLCRAPEKAKLEMNHRLNQSIKRPKERWINQSINQSINQPINQSIDGLTYHT
jgi:hypothetical protein